MDKETIRQVLSTKIAKHNNLCHDDKVLLYFATLIGSEVRPADVPEKLRVIFKEHKLRYDRTNDFLSIAGQSGGHHCRKAWLRAEKTFANVSPIWAGIHFQQAFETPGFN